MAPGRPALAAAAVAALVVAVTPAKARAEAAEEEPGDRPTVPVAVAVGVRIPNYFSPFQQALTAYGASPAAGLDLRAAAGYRWNRWIEAGGTVSYAFLGGELHPMPGSGFPESVWLHAIEVAGYGRVSLRYPGGRPTMSLNLELAAGVQLPFFDYSGGVDVYAHAFVRPTVSFSWQDRSFDGLWFDFGVSYTAVLPVDDRDANLDGVTAQFAIITDLPLPR